MIRIITLSFFICFLSLTVRSQDKSVIKYYDSTWLRTTKDSAFFVAEFVKEGALYKGTVHWVNPRKLSAVGYFADTSFYKPRKLKKNYYQNGRTEDSAWYDENGRALYSYHFYENGKLLARHIYDAKKDKETNEGFDEDGKPIKNFIYLREAEYPDGPNGWMRYLSKNVNTQVPIKNGAPDGKYNTMILFIIDTNGHIVSIQPETNFGYGMEEEAIRVIRNSPTWKPLIHLNKLKNAYRKQPITFVVSSK